MNKLNKLTEQVEDYLRFSQIERGLSANTITAYKQDLSSFIDFLQKENLTSWPTKAIDIDAFLAE